MSDKPGVIGRIFSAFWNGLTRVRMALANVLFLLVLLVLFVAFSGRSPAPLPEKAALLLNPAGVVVEQKSYTEPLAHLLSGPAAQERETLLSDMIDAILYAKDDPSITALVMELDQLAAIGVSKTGEVAEALAEFRESGKPIVAWGDGFSQGNYLLAAEADTLIIHPLGDVLLEGFANYQWYFADALDKLAIDLHVFRAGEYKSIAELFTRNDMSAGEKEITRRWLGQLWGHYTHTVETRRELEPGSVDAYIESFAAGAVAGGDFAQLALDAGLVDRVETRQLANNWLGELVGAVDDYGDYQAVAFKDYLRHARPSMRSVGDKPMIGVVVASGMIYDGEQPAGSIGGDSTASLLQDAIDDEKIAAIVLRVDSGGGSVFGSEIIREKVVQAQAAGKPVVISMGSMAASGGYWIAAPADEIWATPTTLTGSIGVFGAMPTFDKLMARYGVYTDGVGTTSVAGALRPDRPMSPQASAVFQASIDSIYQRFINVVAEGRELTHEQAATLATGGVWSGEDALGLGLVDELGGRRAAVKAPARLAGVEDYVHVTIDFPLTPQEQLLQDLLGSVSLPSLFGTQAAWPGSLQRWSAPLRDKLSLVTSLNDPRGIYAHCLACLAP